MRFLDPDDDVEIYRGKLPHWRQNRVIYFVTFRLYDSLPTSKLVELRQERELWLKLNRAPWSRAQREEYNERFNGRIQEWLDAGVGSCVLGNPELKQVMEGVLKFFDLDRYELDEFCSCRIMFMSCCVLDHAGSWNESFIHGNRIQQKRLIGFSVDADSYGIENILITLFATKCS
jgi:hypothetical protein